MADDTTSTTPPKPGYKTTEFWFKVAAAIVAVLIDSDVFPVGSIAAKITSNIALVLMTLGYTYSRTAIKMATALLFVFVFGATQPSCGHTDPIINVVEDCTINDQAVRDQVQKWIAHFPGWPQALQEAETLGIHIGGCALREFVNTYLTPAPGNHAPDPDQGWAARAAIVVFDRDMKLERVVFKTPDGNL